MRHRHFQDVNVQYIAVASGYGGVYSLFSGDMRLASVRAGGSLWGSPSRRNNA